MKTNLLLISGLICCASFLKAQESVVEVYDLATKAIDLVHDNEYEVVRMELDILTTSIKERSVSRIMVDDYCYKIMAFSDGTVEDFNLYLYEEDKMIKSTASNDHVASIEYQPKENNIFTFYVTAEKFSNDNTAGYFCLIVCHDQGKKGCSGDEKEETKPVGGSGSNKVCTANYIKNRTFTSASIKGGYYDEEKDDITWLKDYDSECSFEFDNDWSYMIYKEDGAKTIFEIKSHEYNADKCSTTMKLYNSKKDENSTWVIDLDDKAMVRVQTVDEKMLVLKYFLE